MHRVRTLVQPHQYDTVTVKFVDFLEQNCDVEQHVTIEWWRVISCHCVNPPVKYGQLAFIDHNRDHVPEDEVVIPVRCALH
jgi:hypothetical protein